MIWLWIYLGGVPAWCVVMGASGSAMDGDAIVTAILWPLAMPMNLGRIVRKLLRGKHG